MLPTTLFWIFFSSTTLFPVRPWGCFSWRKSSLTRLHHLAAIYSWWWICARMFVCFSWEGFCGFFGSSNTCFQDMYCTQPSSVINHFSSGSSSLKVDLQRAVILYPSNGMAASAEDFVSNTAVDACNCTWGLYNPCKSAVRVDQGRKNPCHTGELNLHQQHAKHNA